MAKTRKQKQITLTPKEEAYIVCYVALYYNCDKRSCWKQIGKIIQKYGTNRNIIVYRGQGKADNTIKNISPFLSTTTNKKMAELFVEKDWDQPEKSQRVGHLFKIHLKGAIALSTRDVNYTLTDEVKEELRKINRNRKIEKGDGIYTFDEFFPKIKKLMKELLFPTTDNGEVFLVLNGGIFYKDVELKHKGFSPVKNGDFETWYVSSKLFNKTRKSKS